MSKTYLITGVGSHLGGTVAAMLLAAGARVRGFAQPEADVSALENEGLCLYFGDIRDKLSLRPLFEGIDGPFVVIHAAGMVSFETGKNPLLEEINVGGTENVLALCREYGAQKLIHVGSVQAIPTLPQGQPMREVKRFAPERLQSEYARSAAVATQRVLDAAAAGLNATVVQPSGMIGPNDYAAGYMTQLVLRFMRGRLPGFIRGGYDFVDVRDVADGVLRAAEKGAPGECYILSGHYCTIRELLRTLSRILGRRELKTAVPLWLARLTAPLAELLYKIRRKAPAFSRHVLDALIGNGLYSSAKAARELGYAPRSMSDTLRDTVAFLRQQGRSTLPRRPGHGAAPV